MIERINNYSLLINNMNHETINIDHINAQILELDKKIVDNYRSISYGNLDDRTASMVRADTRIMESEVKELKHQLAGLCVH